MPMRNCFNTLLFNWIFKKCNKFMRNWDEMFYNQYGMCEDCYLKYNAHIDTVKEKLDNEAGEVIKEQ